MIVINGGLSSFMVECLFSCFRVSMRIPHLSVFGRVVEGTEDLIGCVLYAVVSVPQSQFSFVMTSLTRSF